MVPSSMSQDTPNEDSVSATYQSLVTRWTIATRDGLKASTLQTEGRIGNRRVLAAGDRDDHPSTWRKIELVVRAIFDAVKSPALESQSKEEKASIFHTGRIVIHLCNGATEIAVDSFYQGQENSHISMRCHIERSQYDLSIAPLFGTGVWSNVKHLYVIGGIHIINLGDDRILLENATVAMKKQKQSMTIEVATRKVDERPDDQETSSVNPDPWDGTETPTVLVLQPGSSLSEWLGSL